MSNEQTQRSGFGGRHAIVIGAGMAGLLASRVLSDDFEQVTVIERDQLPQEVQVRKGVPQGRHIHVLLYRGAAVIKELFPDLFPALLQKGTVPIDAIADFRWYNFGAWKARFPSTITFYSQTRPFLEEHVRECVAALNNVHFIEACEVTGLCATDDATRITGAHVKHRDGAQKEELLSADLVVDTGGRGSQAPQWLTALGYDKVEETTVKVDVSYASRIYRRPAQTPFDRNVLAIYTTPPQGKRAGALAPIEDDCWIVTLFGWLRDWPPTDEAGYLEFARSLPQPDIYEAIKEAEPLTPITIYKFPANRRRHYERLSRFPEGFVLLGDAVSSFNPIYGQGMTAAALQVNILNACLSQQQQHNTRTASTGFSRHFQKEVAKIVDAFWLLAVGEDFRFPETQGKRPLGIQLLHSYSRRVHELSATDQEVALRLFEVLHQVKPTTALFSLPILAKVLFKRQPKRGKQAATSSPLQR